MTNKLYYQDPTIKTFQANILKSEIDENGNNYVVLDQTHFYPTGGGQPHDTGFINNAEVIDVEEVNDEIRHFTKNRLTVGEKVTASINWDCRFDHMQQHCGQHILSAALASLYSYQTISFHLGKETCTIDLETNSISEEELLEAERLSNEIILENRPIETKWITEEELSHYPLRKTPSVNENIRLVIIPDFDYNACGGTHPTSTAQVSMLKIMSVEKQKNNVRVHFIAGKRVLQQLERKNIITKKLTHLLNAPEDRLVETASSFMENTKQLEKKLVEYEDTILSLESMSLLRHADRRNNINFVHTLYDQKTMKDIQKLGKFLVEQDDDVLAILVIINDEKFQFVCTRGRNVEVNVNTLVKNILPLIDGKGGGNEIMAQGGGIAMIPYDLFVEELVKQIL
ncbi:alanyl-tRNA editing protein [Bacillus alkalisoli]|uniref:alanyl-tRNA editing protein n=1 Tax=Bacillus alkalisoli TaxID=2011008 RepID=UPI000C2323B7|nr:DHHA1 domain-containing protein [Bacillus alkalisoli]